MQVVKRSIVLLLCLTLVVSMFVGCKKSDTSEGTTSTVTETETSSGSETEGENNDPAVAKEIDFSEPVEYTWWLFATPFEYYSSYDQNPVVEYLNEKFNMTLKFQQPSAGTESDALNLMLGTGELTDLIDVQMYSGSLAQLYEDEVIIDIAQYLDYMPNLSKLLEDEKIRKNVYTDNGQILGLPIMYSEDPLMWGGMVYRRDILEAQTNGNVQFPSGNDEPTTIEDWDYMLPLFKEYFEAAGMAEYAPLIIPAQGVFPTNDLLGTFGTVTGYYLDNGKVQYGQIQPGFYDFLAKMKEWYDAGYIYKDFASRTSDMFMLPNTSLTYGLAAGAWFGLNGQLGAALSMPDYGITVDVRPLANPTNPNAGVTETSYSLSNTLYSSKYTMSPAVVITKKCENVERLLATIDYLYSEEGSILKNAGLSAEQGAADNELYANNGLEKGYYYIDANGEMQLNEQLSTVGGPIGDTDAFRATRLPGVAYVGLDNKYSSEESVNASNKWIAYQTDIARISNSISRTSEEDNVFTTNETKITDYVNSMILKFILGSEELNEENWQKYVDQVKAHGIEENIAIMQAAYERYQAR